MNSAMLYHAGQFLCAFTLLLLAGTLTAQNNDDHICKHIMAGDFDKINIGSITSDLYSSSEYNIRIDLIIYLRYNQMYRINMDDVGENSIKMDGIKPTGVDVGSDADMFHYSKEYFHKGAHESKVDLTQLKSFYQWRLTNYLVIKNGLFYGDNKAYTMYSFKHLWINDGISWVKPSEGYYPSEMALVHNQKESSIPTTYAIHRDIYDGTDDFIIYQMWILSNNFELDSLQQINADQASKSSAWYWFLEKTRNSSVVKLANRKYGSHMRDPEFQLFRKQPVGFLHSKNNQPYLFDQALGCVYHLVDWNNEILNFERMKEQDDLFFKRINIPYEKYFKCNSEKFPKSNDFDKRHTPDRCETFVDGNKLGTGNPNRRNFPRNYSEKDGGLPIGWICACIAFILVLVIGLVVLMKTSKEKNSKGKDNKQGSSSVKSATNSTAKSKRTSAHSTSSKSRGKHGQPTLKSKTNTPGSATGKSNPGSKP